MSDPTPQTLTQAEARRSGCAPSGSMHSAPFGDGPRRRARAVEHLGYVQIDTINVIERCHHHILWTRIPDYRRAASAARRRASTRPSSNIGRMRSSYVPTKDLRFFLPAMKRHRRSPPRTWFGKVAAGGPAQGPAPDPQGRRAVDPRHRRRGAGREGPRLGQPQALEARAAAGVLQRRADHQRAGRHAEDLRTDGAAFRLGHAAEARDRSERFWTTCSTARCGRRAWSASIRSAISTPRARPPIRRLDRSAGCAAGSCVPVAIEGAGKGRALGEAARRSTPQPPPARTVHVLSPFDPLIIQRKRLKMFFGYDHRFEAYVPKEKRVLGYFALPDAGRGRNRRRHRPQGRPRAAEAADPAMDLGRARGGAIPQGARSRRPCTASSRFQFDRPEQPVTPAMAALAGEEVS